MKNVSNHHPATFNSKRFNHLVFGASWVLKSGYLKVKFGGLETMVFPQRYVWICLRCLEKVNKSIFPNGGLIVIYYVKIRPKQAQNNKSKILEYLQAS